MLMGLLLLVLGILSSCGQTQNGTNGSGTKEKTEQNTRNVCHFASFEVTFPEGWTSRGNLEKVYEPDLSGAYFALAGSGQNPEEKIRKGLALLYSTEFYAEKIRFQYDERKAVPYGERVTGTIFNDRNGSTMQFCGYYIQEPACHFVYFGNNAVQQTELEKNADESFEGYTANETPDTQ